MAAVDAAGCFDDADSDCEDALEELADAADDLAGAEEEILAGNPDKAVDRYKKAWEASLEAIDELG